ncbi:MAG: sensor histidine kinase [Bacteroidetes bacterium]|nr:MAG: sensor histidine kinase [Bacteroidota bacterium]
MQGAPEVIAIVSAGIGIMLLLALTFVLFFNFSQGKLRREQLKAQAARLAHQEELLHSNILTQEEERGRIAKDLHDEVGSKLNVLHLYLHQLRKKAPDAQDSIQDMLSVINDTIHTTRRISHDLLPPTLASFGLQVAIEELCERVEQAHAMEISFTAEGDRPSGIAPIVELNLFRILNELLSNTLKYAQASQVHIHLWQQPGQLRLQYRDNGRGFDSTDPAHQKGLGMQNIQSRLQMMAGELDLHSAPGEGVRVQLSVKLPLSQPLPA